MLKIAHIMLFNIRCSVISMKQIYPFFFCLLLPLVLPGCNNLSPKVATNEEVVAQPSPAEAAVKASAEAAPTVDSTADIATPKKEVKLDGDTLFNLLAAEFAGNSGNVDASLDYYREASKTIQDSRVAARTAYIALYGEHYEEALQALDRWSELEPNALDLPRMYAVTYLKLGQIDKAVPYIEKMISGTHESSSEKALAVKDLLAKETGIESAYSVLQKMNAGPDKNVHLLVLQSRYAAQLKQYDEALGLLDEVLEKDPSLNEVQIIKARILSAQGKDDEAVATIKQLVDKLPDNNTLRLQYARMLVEQRKMPEATDQYVILHKNLPDDSEILLSLALLYIDTQQLDEAVDVLEQLAEIDEKAPVANYYLGRIAQNRGNQKQAVSYYLGVNSGEYAFDAQLRIGILLAILGKPDEGLAKLEALSEAQTNWALRVKTYIAQGEILRSEKRFKEAVELYSSALQQQPDDITLLYARGLMAEKVDRLDMAEADLLEVIAKEPDNADALNALGYTLADRTSRYEEALAYIQRAAKLVPDDPAILDSLGWVNYRLGHTDEAIKWLSQAFNKLQDAEIAAHYGEVLWSANQKDKAREIWKKGKAEDAKNPVLVETLKRIKPF
jgi:tetratricopeptide (TPR) repeat protein